MKRMILSATLLFFLAGFANAQTGNGGSSSGSRSSSSVSNASQANKGQANKGRSSMAAGNKAITLQNYNVAKEQGVRSSTLEDVEITTSAPVDNTKEHLYPDGQVATPTGHDATPTNGGYAALGKNPSDANKGRNTTAATNTNNGSANTSTANNNGIRNKTTRE